MRDLPSSTALLTDRYELTMLDAAVGSGVAGRRAVFEVFARSLPPGRRYGVFGGLGRLVEAIGAFGFDDDEVDWLVDEDIVGEDTGEWLRSFRFSGDVDAYPEGECYFPGSPVLTIESTFGEAVLLETIVLSILNFDSAVASAASRMVGAAAGRPVIEMGSRRTHELAAVAAARVAYIAGATSTSNLEAGRRYGIPTAGTAAHAFILAHKDERTAFAAQLDAMGTATTLLVDTYDVTTAITTAVDLARERGASGPGAIRLDSGDLVDESVRARALLDELGAHETRIVITSDLDEYAIAALTASPADVYGVGTRIVTGSGAPTAGFVYKLVSVASEDGRFAAMHPVEKRSPAKHSLGARKLASRWIDDEGVARVEFLRAVEDEAPAEEGPDEAAGGVPLPEELPAGWEARDLQRRIFAAGSLVEALPSLAESREHHRWSLRELGAAAFDLRSGPPLIPTRYRSLGGTTRTTAAPGRTNRSGGETTAAPGETTAGAGRTTAAGPSAVAGETTGSAGETTGSAGETTAAGRAAQPASGPEGGAAGGTAEEAGEVGGALASVSEIRPGASAQAATKGPSRNHPSGAAAGAGRIDELDESGPARTAAPSQVSRALVVVDVQRDFCEGGSLAVTGGNDVAERICALLGGSRENYAAVVASRDRHVNPGTHFARAGDVPDYETSWPVHCVVGSDGAELHELMAGVTWDAVFDKGATEAAYSAFEGREPGGLSLATWLLDRGIESIDVCGIATDYCVRSTVLDGVQAGFATRVLVGLTAGVSPLTSERALGAMAEAGAELAGDDVAGTSLATQFARDEL